jgi:flagellar FliJ protein
MAKFNYRLQSLLNVKNQLEDKTKNELAKQIAKLNEEKEKLESIYNQKDDCFLRITEESIKGTNIHTLKQYGSYLSLINSRLSRQRESVNSAVRDVDIHREKLIEISKEKKMLEMLKDKKLQQHLYNELQKEEKKTEEVVNYRYITAKF